MAQDLKYDESCGGCGAVGRDMHICEDCGDWYCEDCATQDFDGTWLCDDCEENGVGC